MTRADVLALLAMTVANYPGMQERELGPTAELWYNLLKAEEYALAQAGLFKVLAHAKHFPTIGEVLEAIESLKPKHELPTPEEAWGELVRQVDKVGRTGRPEWSHPAIAKASDALYGNWVNLCMNMTQDSMPADRAHFFRLYKTYTDREREHAALPGQVRSLIDMITAKLALPDGK